MRDDPRRRRADISRACAELGWSPLVPPARGLADTVEWFARDNAEPLRSMSD